MNTKIGLAIVSLIFATKTNALDYGVGVKAGTTGTGVDFSLMLSKTINARVSLTSIDIDDRNENIKIGDEDNKGEIDAELELDYGARALFFDWYVFDGSFNLTAGVFRNNGLT